MSRTKPRFERATARAHPGAKGQSSLAYSAARPESRRTDGWTIAWGGLLVAALLAGFWLVNDFGESWDEQGIARLGEAALESYKSGEPLPPGLGDLARHGPIVAAFTKATTDLLRQFHPEWAPYQARHRVLYGFFLAAVACFYSIARRWVGRGPAILATSVFAWQPLLFGHAFINPNDGPFLTLFSLTFLLGLQLADSVGKATHLIDNRRSWPEPQWSDLTEDWKQADLGRRRQIGVWLVILTAVGMDLLLLHAVVLPVLQGLVRAAYEGRAWGPVNDLFRLVAEDAAVAPVEAYYGRLWHYYAPLRWVALAILALPGVRLVPRFLVRIGRSLWDPSRALRAGASGAVLGAAAAVRLIGPFAGCLVSLVILWRGKYRSLGTLLVYWTSAAVFAYLAWPSLWGSPVTSYLDYLRQTLSAPFDNQVLFDGQIAAIGKMPWTYHPTFLVLQTTLPGLVLAACGVGVGLFGRTWKPFRIEIAAAALWAIVPLAAAAALRSTSYDNSRHFLFVRVGFLLFGALAIDIIWRSVKSQWIRLGIGLAMVLPGWLGIWRLHPYEYVYFNELVGGVRGAHRRFELDYWGLSFSETTRFVNRMASPGASIVVHEPSHLFRKAARVDLVLIPFDPLIADLGQGAEYAMATSRLNQDLELFPKAPVVFIVERDGAVLAVVKDLR